MQIKVELTAVIHSPQMGETMRPLVFEVQERRAGWYVVGETPIGPFPSEERAMDLATGMAVELNRRGVPTEVRRLAVSKAVWPSWRPWFRRADA